MENRYMEEQLRKYKPFTLLLRLTLPAVAAQLFNALYNIVDRMFIGHRGEGLAALSGLGICFPIISLITAFAWLVGMGGAPLLSICLGEKNETEAARIQTHSLLMLFCIGISLTMICFFGAEPLLKLFGASDTQMPYARTYLQIYVLGSTAMMITTGMNSFINAQGHMVLGTVTVAFGAAVNILLDWLFLFKFHMGIRGAAIATVISQVLSSVWVLWLLFFSKKLEIKISLHGIKPQLIYIKKICALGVSSFVFMANESLVGIVLNRLIRIHEGYGESGDLYIGALTVVVSMSQLFFMPLRGVTQGAQPIVGYCKGAGNYKRMAQTIRDARILGTISALTFWIFLMFAPAAVAAIFTNDVSLIRLSETTLRLSFWECFIFGFQMINQHTFIAMGNAKYSFLFAIMRKVLLLIPIACILPYFIGVQGIFLGESIASIITAVFTQIAFTYYMKRLKVEMAET